MKARAHGPPQVRLFGRASLGVAVAVAALVALKFPLSLGTALALSVTVGVHAVLAMAAFGLAEREPGNPLLGLSLAGNWRGAFWPTVVWVPLGSFAVAVWLIILGATGINVSGPSATAEAARGSLGIGVVALLFVLITPITEELFYRGFLFTTLRQRTSFWPAALLSSLLFALGHPELLLVPGHLVQGLLLCQAFRSTKTLLAPIAMHIASNALAVYLLAT